jgi:chromosome segregation ATPase
MTEQELQAQVNALESQLIDAQVDLNISEDKVRKLEKELAEANARIRELERDTMTIQTLSLDDEDANFDPRNTGQFYGWKGGTR